MAQVSSLRRSRGYGGLDAALTARRAGLRHGRSGFTLVELLIVIAIAAILMGIVVPSFVSMSRQHRQATCAANLKAIGQALAIFHADYGCYPPDSTEYLWTPAAAQAYASDYGTAPPNYRLGTLTDAASHPQGSALEGLPFETEMHGLGLLTLYYIGAYASVLPPRTSDPRFPRPGEPDYPPSGSDPMHLRDVRSDKGYNQFSWFKGGGYITKLDTFHCPNNETTYQSGDLLDHSKLPGLGTWDATRMEWTTAWNNYDQRYHRYHWHPGQQPPSLAGLLESANPTDRQRYWDLVLNEGATRNLWQANPPVDTVVTWCPYHRRGEHHLQPADRPGREDAGGHHAQEPDRPVTTGDKDPVLFVDGSVRRMTSREDDKMYDASLQDAGWPAGPVM